jgi:DNA invertase Pin-like site-specific DNA recombinase
METFKMVNDLLRYDIKVYSLTEGLLDFTDSSKFFPLLIQAGAAQHENIVRSENVKRGMRQALKEGRWVWNAPLGYKNNKATKLIEIDKENGPLVKQGFEMLATGAFSADEVRRKLIESGLKNVSKQTFLNMLRNIAYYGFIRVNATNEEPEQIVPAVHEPLISETLFMKVRGVLDGKKKIVQAM